MEIDSLYCTVCAIYSVFVSYKLDVLEQLSHKDLPQNKGCIQTRSHYLVGCWCTQDMSYDLCLMKWFPDWLLSSSDWSNLLGVQVSSSVQFSRSNPDPTLNTTLHDPVDSSCKTYPRRRASSCHTSKLLSYQQASTASSSCEDLDEMKVAVETIMYNLRCFYILLDCAF